MTIDISKIQVGDTVTVGPMVASSPFPPRDSDTVTLGPFEVTRRDAVSGYVSVRIGGGDYTFDADLIASHTPQPHKFQVGDRVTYNGGGVGTIRGIDGDQAWVQWRGSMNNWTVSASDLTLVDPNQ